MLKFREKNYAKISRKNYAKKIKQKFREKKRKFCEEEIMRITQKLLMSHNKTSHIEVSEQRIPQV